MDMKELIKYYGEDVTTIVYPFDEKSMEKVAPWKCGTYELGIKENDEFKVLYVGRAGDGSGERGLRDRLEEHLWEKQSGKKFVEITYFSVNCCNDVLEAFNEECKGYHKFKEWMGTAIYNKIHPARPTGTDYPCPVEGCEELD